MAETMTKEELMKKYGISSEPEPKKKKKKKKKATAAPVGTVENPYDYRKNRIDKYLDDL